MGSFGFANGDEAIEGVLAKAEGEELGGREFGKALLVEGGFEVLEGECTGGC